MTRAASLAVFFLLTSFALYAKSSLYRRAADLADEDPREAEALYVGFIAESGNDKLKRAAAHELFTLRLKQGRLTEAFFQAKSSAFRSRLLSALEEHLRLDTSLARRLVTSLRKECSGDGDAEKIAKLLARDKYPVATYSFAVTILTRCNNDAAASVIPDFPEEIEKIDGRAVNFALLEIREAIGRDDFETATSLLGEVRKNATVLIEKEPGYGLQLDFAEARLASKQEDYEDVLAKCASIEKRKPPRWVRNACRSLTAYCLLKQGKAAEAYARIASLKITPQDIDNRLLRLTAAVAAEEAPAEKLRKFTRRRSYKECAPLLQKLAEGILLAAAQNR